MERNQTKLGLEEPESYWPMEIWRDLEQQTHKAVAENDSHAISVIKCRMSLLNPTFLVWSPDVSNLWEWCLMNSNKSYHLWKPENTSLYEEILSKSPNLLEKARAAYVLWTLTRRHEYAETAVRDFVEVGRLYLANNWYDEYEMISFCFEFAATLSLSLQLKSPID